MRAARIRSLDLPVHPRFAGFDAFARREILPWLAQQEANRRRAVRQFIGIVAGTVVVVPLLLLLAFGVLGTGIEIGIIVFGVFPAFVGGTGAFMMLAAFRRKMKGVLLPKVCEQLKLRYVGRAPDFPFDAFVRAGMLPRHDKHGLDDGIVCDEQGVLFSAAEARLTVRRRTKNGTTDSTVWRGLLLAAHAPRKLKGLTLVMPARGFVARLFESRPAEPVDLGLPDLVQGLEIRSTFPEEARMILTERVMRRFAELARRLGDDKPSLAIVDDDVLLAIRSPRDRFEGGSLWKPMDDPARIEALLHEIDELLALAAALGEAFRLERARPGGRPDDVKPSTPPPIHV